ncbi:membrane protein [Tatumella morbirosei]|uniref:Ubiquinone biosynthesis accessory factor UbiJ n=1 Tax=Tatumella morbirosei TaxID=642227 RepID=A0A095V0U1_9GAMM|nr:SCP2 domain-containing protein [Tatumella morbirosei]KGD80113.1 membrane protein [Tatumella morbirosei]
MTAMPLLTATIENVLNRVLYQDRGLKPARQRLKGKVLTLKFSEFSRPLVLVFGEQQLDVVGDWQDSSDCTVSLALGVLPELRDRQNLTSLIRQGKLDVQGDLQVIQQFSALMDLAELDPAEYLAPFVGDIAAQGISRAGQRLFSFVRQDISSRQRQLGEILTEEWRAAPGTLEVAWFCEETAALDKKLAALDARLAQWEKK